MEIKISYKILKRYADITSSSEVISNFMSILFKSTLIFLLVASGLNLNAQNSIIDTDKQNPIFNCRYEIYNLQIDFTDKESKPPYPVTLDTFNICRVQNQRISRLRVYYFKTPHDSSLWREISYLPNGLIHTMEPSIGWFMYAAINPDTVSIDCTNYSNGKISDKIHIRKQTKLKEIYQYDSTGYLIQYTTTERGLLNRWTHRKIGGVPVRWITTYTYKNNYLEVIINRCGHWTLKSDSCWEGADQIVCEFNAKGNILSEKHYELDGSGQRMFVHSFKYEYDYFDE